MPVVFEADKSGINSLGGFSYQIKVFVYYISQLKEGMQVEFENHDDVSFSRVNAEMLDEESENYKNTVIENDSITSIQVKRTAITNEVARQTLLNWILLEASDFEVSRYIMFTDARYNNEDRMFDISCEDLFALVSETGKGERSTIGKVKKYFKGDYQLFSKTYESIKSKYKFNVSSDIDQEIAKAYSELFRKVGVSNEIIYFHRLKALLERITSDILEKVNNKESYSISYKGFMKLIEHITSEISDDNPILDYMSFKRMCSIDVNDLSISNLRQYKQLKSCELTIPLIETNLTYGFYYEHFRFTNSELNKVIKIENVENTAFDNYNAEKFDLQKSNNDNPYNRLEGTKNRVNSYADNEQIKYGVAIYLTKDNIGDKQISWEDE